MNCDPAIMRCVTEVVVPAEEFYKSAGITAIALMILFGLGLYHLMKWIEKRFPPVK